MDGTEVGLRGRGQPGAPPSEERLTTGSGDSNNHKQITFPVSWALKILLCARLLSGLGVMQIQAFPFLLHRSSFCFLYTTPPQSPSAYCASPCLGSPCCSLQGGGMFGGVKDIYITGGNRKFKIIVLVLKVEALHASHPHFLVIP